MYTAQVKVKVKGWKGEDGRWNAEDERWKGKVEGGRWKVDVEVERGLE